MNVEMLDRPERPLGVAIIAVLDIIGGILMVFGGLVLVSLGPVLSTMPFEEMGGYPGFAQFMGILGGVIGSVILIIGIIAVALGYFLWNGHEFARLVHIALALLSLLGGLASLAMLSVGGVLDVIIAIIIVYYLTRPHVKEFFKASKE